MVGIGRHLPNTSAASALTQVRIAHPRHGRVAAVNLGGAFTNSTAVLNNLIGGGLLRIDISTIFDVYAEVRFDNSNADGGLVQSQTVGNVDGSGGFIGPITYTTYMYEMRPKELFAINEFFPLAGLVLMGAIIGAWTKKSA